MDPCRIACRLVDAVMAYTALVMFLLVAIVASDAGSGTLSPQVVFAGLALLVSGALLFRLAMVKGALAASGACRPGKGESGGGSKG